MTSRRTRRAIWIIAGALIVFAGGYALARGLGAGTMAPISEVIAAPPVGDLPVMPEKPPASPEGFMGCPPEGEGGDAALNRLKNRVDKGAYEPVSLHSLLALTWPRSAEGQSMGEWTPSGRAFIEQYLGIPVVAEGYVDSLRLGGADSANCNREDDASSFWQIHLVEEPRGRRVQSLVATSTPQTRVGHTWTPEYIRDVLVAGRLLVRVSGWLYFDPNRGQELGRSRATLWEITPLMQIEVFQDGRWNPLDKYGK